MRKKASVRFLYIRLGHASGMTVKRNVGDAGPYNLRWSGGAVSLPKGEGDRRQVLFALLLSGVSAYKVTLGGKIENFSKEKLLTLLLVYSKIEVDKNRKEIIYVKFINNAS